MASLEGRVAIVTGAGRGLGREHSLLLAAEGARVVVNDLDAGPAEEVVDAIRAFGGEAIANTDNVAEWAGAEQLVRSTVDAYGDLHVLVNNAGILRDRFLVNMSEEEWDAVVTVHLKGHFAPTRFAAAYWRDRSKAGDAVRASVINTSSTSGLLGNPGQTNYGAAKAGIAAFTQICAMELSRYGVRSNAIAPAARTRMTEATPGLGDVVKPPDDPEHFDVWDPANVSPLVAFLAREQCTVNGQVFFIRGGTIQLFRPWALGERLERNTRWTVEELETEMKRLVRE
ncbi:MAG: SDR family oxidoreductase [Actinomycetota bacterium]|nr:SDR family oxidoreductase [Actinomycetota bacterium]